MPSLSNENGRVAKIVPEPEPMQEPLPEPAVLHSADQIVSSKNPKVNDIKGRFWKMTGVSTEGYQENMTFQDAGNTFFVVYVSRNGENSYILNSPANVQARGVINTVTSCADKEENENGNAIADTVGPCIQIQSVANDTLVLEFTDQSGLVGQYKRVTGEEAKGYQAVVDAYEAKQSVPN